MGDYAFLEKSLSCDAREKRQALVAADLVWEIIVHVVICNDVFKMLSVQQELGWMWTEM